MHALLMIGTGVSVPPARGRRNRDAQAQKRSPRTTGRRGESYFWGDLSESAYRARGKVSRSAAPKPNQHAPGGILASVSWHLAAVRADSAAGRGRTLGAEQVTAGVQSGIAHGARAGTSLLPQLCLPFPKRSAGWLRAG